MMRTVVAVGGAVAGSACAGAHPIADAAHKISPPKVVSRLTADAKCAKFIMPRANCPYQNADFMLT
jgi:hypothetical protein